MWKRIEQTGGKKETVQSYLGLLGHGDTYKLQTRVLKTIDIQGKSANIAFEAD